MLPSEKDDARELVLRLLRETNSKRFTALRINDPNTAFGLKDLDALKRLAPVFPFSAVVLPKVESPDTVTEVARVLNNSLPIWCMIETAKGVLRAASIAELPEVSTLVLGSNDLTKDLHARHTPSREPLLLSMATCVLAARAHRKAVLDGVHIDIDDDTGLRNACVQARDMGFDGKTLIHPRQIDITNEVFSPSATEIIQARKIVDAWEVAQKAGQGVVLVEGKLVEYLHVEDAQRLLNLHALINKEN